MKLEAQLDGNISLGVSSIGIGATAGDIRGFIYHAEKRCRTAAILHFFFRIGDFTPFYRILEVATSYRYIYIYSMNEAFSTG